VSLDRCTLLEFPKISDHRGNLTFIEQTRHVPFDIKRVFYVYDIPSGESRGAHAHRELEQVIVCLSGSLDVSIDDGRERKTVHLNRPWHGLYVPSMIWAAEGNFDPGTVYMVLTSAFYTEADYLRSYDEFLAEVDRRHG
jgi:oxalate decarboxylase/phosphoglucose isomerase-like protein (cupin superfamily)